MLIERIAEGVTITPGPDRFFGEEYFHPKANLRELHKLAFADFDRARGRFCTPSFLMGYEYRQMKVIDTKHFDVVVQIEETEYDMITYWDGEKKNLLPIWRIRVARDHNHRMRGIKDPCMRGPCYHSDKFQSHGPFFPTSEYIYQLLRN